MVLNVTATGPTAASYLTVWPAGASQPLASNLNFTSGETVPNLVTVAVPSSGEVSIYNADGSTDVVVDVEGYYADRAGTTGLFNPLEPLSDLRHPKREPLESVGARSDPVRGQDALGRGDPHHPGGRHQPVGNELGGCPLLGGRGRGAQRDGHRPDGGELPHGVAGGGEPARRLQPELHLRRDRAQPGHRAGSSSGPVSIYNADGSTNVVVDVNGWFTNGSSNTQTGDLFTSSSPSRICDTRASSVRG